MALKMTQTEDQAKAHVASLGVPVDVVDALKAAGLTFWQIVGLIWQFGKQYGAELFTIVMAVVNAIQLGMPPNGDVTKMIAALEAIYQQYGADVAKMAVLIASWFGITITEPAPKST